jgi:crotonobetainyl-CoA:carnitine CoA-transferase CaiB-like acyl-CoA transferase
VAIAVATDEQWAGLVQALGHARWATDPRLSTTAGRRQHHDLIDEHLGAWCECRSGEEIVGCLWDAPVVKVMQPQRQTEPAQLAFRGFFEAVEHPVKSPVPYSTMPARFSAGPQRFHRHAAPLLGQHNRELLTGLGLSDHEIAELESDGIIGSAPRGARKANKQ